MLKRFLLYGMPLYIAAIEWGMRNLLQTVPGRPEDASFALLGPTIGVAGITLILPVLTPKPVSRPASVPRGLSVAKQRDQTLIEVAYIAFFVLLGAWAYSIYLVHLVPPSRWGLGVGGAAYGAGIALTEWKEWV